MEVAVWDKNKKFLGFGKITEDKPLRPWRRNQPVIQLGNEVVTGGTHYWMSKTEYNNIKDQFKRLIRMVF